MSKIRIKKTNRIIVAIKRKTAFAALRDTGHALHPFAIDMTLTSPRPHRADRKWLLYIPGSDNNLLSDSSFDSDERDDWMTETPLGDGGPGRNAIWLHVNNPNIRFHWYPWFLRMTDAALDAATPVFMPASVISDPTPRQMTWREYFDGRLEVDQEIAATVPSEYKIGDMTNLGFSMDLGIAKQIIDLADPGIQVIDEATAIALVMA